LKVFPVIISYWITSIPTVALITIFLVIAFAFHLMPNSWFAEFEFCTGAVKVTTMAIVLISVLVSYIWLLLLGTSNVAASPFAIAMGYPGTPVLPHIINVVLLICLYSIGSESLFIASRIQTAMAKMGMIPRIFSKIDDKGRPVWSLAACSLTAIAMKYVSFDNWSHAFNWFSFISATTTFFAWMVRPDFKISKHRELTDFDGRPSQS
jgi:amino acid transporter